MEVVKIQAESGFEQKVTGLMFAGEIKNEGVFVYRSRYLSLGFISAIGGVYPETRDEMLSNVVFFLKTVLPSRESTLVAEELADIWSTSQHGCIRIVATPWITNHQDCLVSIPERTGVILVVAHGSEFS